MSLKVTSLTAKQSLFSDVSFELAAGEVLAIIGPNGAGKTSLLKSLVDEWPCEQGEVSYHGLALKDWPAVERAKQLAILPQQSLLNFPYTVEEVVMLGRTPHATGQKVDRAMVDAAIAEVDLGHLRQKLYTQLSGGEKQRTQLARAMTQISSIDEANDDAPRYLFLDEPTSSLDLGHQKQLMQWVQRFAQQGVSIVMVVHDVSLAARYADRLLAMREGRVVAFGSAHEVVSESVMKELYQVDVKVIPHPETGFPVVLGV